MSKTIIDEVEELRIENEILNEKLRILEEVFERMGFDISNAKDMLNFLRKNKT